MIYDNILECIGKTPLVKINRIGSDLKCHLFAKIEFFNPGGSVKDRIAYHMILEAERTGQIKPGDTLVEPTSGNTGIGIALAGAIRGYKVVITMPRKMSQEKQVVLEALGATIIRTPNEVAYNHPDSHISIAEKMAKENPRTFVLDQYANQANPKAHYEGTAAEILEDLNGKVDMFVGGAGTGGTLTGVGTRLKKENPNCVIVGADPEGSILAEGSAEGVEQKGYEVEGIGYDFIPSVLNREVVDQWIKTKDEESFQMARKLIREEGLLIGGSCGSAMVAALKAAKTLPEGANCVVLLPDGIRNYLSKYVSNQWMQEKGFSTEVV